MADRRFPIQGGGSIPWAAAELAYETYSKLFGTTQSLERLAERGGFGDVEFLSLIQGINPREYAIREPGWYNRHKGVVG